MKEASNKSPLGLAIVMPSQNDFQSASVLANQLFDQFKDQNLDLRIFIIDDGSEFIGQSYFFESDKVSAITKILYTDVKSGHQMAIINGLAWVSVNFPTHHVMVMDADGEDRPEDAPKLLDKLLENPEYKVVLAERGKRNVNFAFLLGYKIFSNFFKMFVGKEFKTGNFMIIKNTWVQSATELPTASLHISMAIQRYCPSSTRISINRGSRLIGKSRMNYTTLTMHAYGALAVYADIFLSRILIILFPLILFFFSIPVILTILRALNLVNFQKGWVSLIATFSIGIGLILLAQVILSVLIMLRISSTNKRRENALEIRN